MRGIRRVLVLIVLLLGSFREVAASSRFGRRVLEVKDKGSYKFVSLDDISFPFLEGDSAVVSCITYRGSLRYYVEVSVTNKSNHSLRLGGEPIRFSKPGYTSFRTNALLAAKEAADAAGVPFEPTPPPRLPPTSTIDMTETSSGTGYSHTTGTVRTGQSGVEQGAANLGNALGNLFAARSFASKQSEEARFAHFLTAFAIDAQPDPIAPGTTQVVVATFEQVKNKRAPFDITVVVEGAEFPFHFQEWN